MIDLATARTNFLAKVEDYAPGQSVRFAPALDELIRWSDEQNGLVRFCPHNGVHHLVKFGLPDVTPAFWCVTPRTGDGAKLTVMAGPHAAFPEHLRAEARVELAKIDGREPKPDCVPEVALTKLIWAPYRARVIELLARLLAAVHAEAEVAK